jgi:hypothetical protein
MKNKKVPLLASTGLKVQDFNTPVVLELVTNLENQNLTP